MKYLVSLFLMASISYNFNLFFSQERKLVYEKRIEFDYGDDESIMKMNTIGKEGLLLYTEPSDEKKSKSHTFTVHKYNTDLVEINQIEIEVPFKKYRSASFQDEDHQYDLYIDIKTNELVIFKTNVKTLETKQTQATLPKKVYYKGFLITGNTAFVTGVLKGEDVVFTIDLNTGKQQIAPLLFSEIAKYKIKLISIQQAYNSEDVIMLISGQKKKMNQVLVAVFDKNGQKKDHFLLTKEGVDKKLISIRGTSTGDSEFTFTGTYSSRSSTTSEGVFICKTVGKKIEFINFTNYLDLNNFTKYLTEKKQEKIENKKQKKAAKGKSIKLNYFVATHPIITTDDGYLFLGECYYPTYRTETYTTYSNGRPVTQTRQVFDGYQYTHAVIVKYDKNGNKVWDQIIDMFIYYKPFYVKRFIHVGEDLQKSIKMVYSTSKYINYKEFDWDGKILQEETSDEIETGIEGDKTKYTNSQIDFWYESYFLSFGTQKIKNKTDEKEVKKKRIVYFLSKIKF